MLIIYCLSTARSCHASPPRKKCTLLLSSWTSHPRENSSVFPFLPFLASNFFSLLLLTNVPIRYLKQAADQDHEEAQFHLGVCYAEGVGVKKDEQTAKKYLELAAGTLAETVQEYVDQSQFEAMAQEEEMDQRRFKLTQALADEGEEDAQCQVGLFYSNGKGVEQDEVMG